MSAVVFNLLLAFVGVFAVVGLVGLPALLQWPVPASSSRRPVFAGPRRPAGGTW